MTFAEILEDLELTATVDRSETGIVVAKVVFDSWKEGRDASAAIVQRMQDGGFNYVGGDHDNGQNWNFRFVDKPEEAAATDNGSEDNSGSLTGGADNASDNTGSDSSNLLDVDDFS